MTIRHWLPGLVAFLLSCTAGEPVDKDSDSEIVLSDPEEIRSWSEPCLARQNLRGTQESDLGSYYFTRIGPLEADGDLAGAAMWLSEDFEDSGEDLCDPTLEVELFAFVTDEATPPEVPEFLFQIAASAVADDSVDSDRWKLEVLAETDTAVTAGRYVWVGIQTTGVADPFQFTCVAACGGDNNVADNDWISGSDEAPFTWQDINESAPVDLYAAALIR